MKARTSWCAAFLLAAGGAAAGPSIDYQGRITAGGAGCSSPGYFKFVLTDGAGNGLWSNDGTPGTNPPAGAVTVEVNNGVFTVALGRDTAALSPLVFHAAGLRLRTWFSTNSAGPFELLQPDVELEPPDFAHLNTGDLLIVDDDGGGDFQDPQAAVDYLAQKPQAAGLIVMPGYYELSAPLTFPTNRSDYQLYGWGDARRIEIANPSGPAARLQRVTLENISLCGNPAVSDAGAEPHYWFEARRCRFRRAAAGGAAVALENEGRGEFTECRFENMAGGAALELSGPASVAAAHCLFQTANGSAPDVLLQDVTADIELESCRLDTAEASPASLLLRGGSGALRARQCAFSRGVTVSNSAAWTEWSGCELAGLRVHGGSGGLNCRECRLSAPDGATAVLLDGGNGSRWFQDCFLWAQSNTTMMVRDALGDLRLKNCEIHANGAAALELIGTPALAGPCWANAQLLGGRVLSSGPHGGGSAALTVSNAPGNPERGVELALEAAWSDIRSDSGDGLRVERGEATLFGSGVHGQRHGLALVEGSAEADGGTAIYGEACGIWATNAEVMLRGASVEGGTDGLRLKGGAVFAEDASLSGGDSDEEDGRAGDALHADGDLSELAVVLLRSTLDGNAPPWDRTARGLYLSSPTVSSFIAGCVLKANTALECDGGRHWVCDSTLLALAGDGGPCARLYNGATQVAFEKSALTLLDPGSTNALLVLHGTGSNTNTPAPQLIGCTLRSNSTNRYYAIDLGGTLKTGLVAMVHCALSTNLNPKVANTAPTPDTRGNLILPWPR